MRRSLIYSWIVAVFLIAASIIITHHVHRHSAKQAKLRYQQLTQEQVRLTDAGQFWLQRAITVEADIAPADSERSRIRKIREWAYANINRADSQCLFEEEVGYQIYHHPPFEVSYMAIDQGLGYWCGGTGLFLADLYKLFGFEAGIIDVGIPEVQATHVVTLVQLSDGLISLQDAYFNEELITRNGTLADFGMFLKDLHQHQSEDYVFQTGKGRCKPLVGTNERLLGPEKFTHYNAGRYLKHYTDKVTRCHEFTFANFTRQDDKILHELEKVTGQPDRKYIYTLPLGGTELAFRFITCDKDDKCKVKPAYSKTSRDQTPYLSRANINY
ncbi:hypothetical protein [Polycladidibacter hongkongensis]|uniref:hypothetical protein n=1 Tax=Polycladidibacter hongkongensis TaxID=1647556 RepID=UPI00082DA3DB|nr:hypothetical protein [Pseudovibrio hongkongensis]